ncbi:MAG: hypothetical protein WA821_03170, partial [Anaerolineales bacterium]
TWINHPLQPAVSPHLSVVGNRDTEYTGEHEKNPLKKLAESVQLRVIRVQIVLFVPSKGLHS